jgi:FAD/FMN-containing dehydrogenase
MTRTTTTTTRRQVLAWMAGTAGLLAAGPGARAARGTAGREAAWAELREPLGSKLVLRSSPAFDRDRRAMVWSARKPDRQPEALVHAGSERDVEEAVRFAARNRLKVAVRGGGHHFNAPAVREGGLLLDLSGLDEIAVDAGARTATVQPGVSARRFLAALAPHGLAFPVGHCSSVPLSGFLLNGGIGWNGGAWGPACLSVTGLEVVNAKGESLRVDAESHPELFWAARGAGTGFFGIVTRFHLALHPLPGAIRTSTLSYRVDDLDEVAAWLPTLRGSLPPRVELIGLLLSPPPEARANGAPARVFVVSATAFAGSPAEAETWLAPLENGPEGVTPTAGSHLVDTPFDALFASIDAVFPAGHRYAADHAWSGSPPRELLASVRDAALSPPSPGDFLLLAFAPPAPEGAPPLPDMALSKLGAIYGAVYGVWSDAAEDEANRAWVRTMSAALEPHRVGRYIGDADLEAGPDSARQCFSDAAWERLAALKRQYDPEDRFFSYSLGG